MTAEILSGMLTGIQGNIITIQTDISDGLPIMQMIGYLASEVKEAKERVKTALKNSGYHLPPRRISVNLSPGDIKKNGVSFDLGIAISLLASMGIIYNHQLKEYIFLGELALDGRLCPIRGVLPIVHEGSRQGIYKCILPLENAQEAEMIESLEVFTFHTLKEVIAYLNGQKEYVDHTDYSDWDISSSDDSVPPVDFSAIRGQEFAKRALTIAAAGFHNILLEGPPGCGKSLMASALPGIMPPLSWHEYLDVLMIHSAKGLLNSYHLPDSTRPYRSIGAGITKVGLLGGGRNPIPGEITLAHHGVLFLDELAEMDRSTIEMLRTPLENHTVHIIRNEQQYTFPSDFLLVCASNPCPCGYYPNRNQCRCTQSQIHRYQSRISGPIRDRIDLFVHCDLPSYEELSNPLPRLSSSSMRKLIIDTWDFQQKRQGKLFNSRLNQSQIEEFCSLDAESKEFMKDIFTRFQLTARTYYKVIKTARTIADFSQSDQICIGDLKEALQYRISNM